MAKFKPWLKMWITWVDEPKYLRMTMAEQNAYWRVYALAHRCNAGGLLVTDSGSPLSVEEIANTLHIISSQDTKALKSMLEKMDKEHEIFMKDGALFIASYEESQSLSPSNTKEAMAERQRRHREMQSPSKEKESSKEKETTDIEAEAEAECHDEKLVTRHSNSVTAEAALAEIAKLHEEYFGIITSNLSEKFKDFVENYRGPVEWIKEAFAEAVKYKNRRWQYVEAILYSWQEKGGPHADRRERGDEGQRTGAAQRDIIAEATAGGWEVLSDDEPETTEAGNQS